MSLSISSFAISSWRLRISSSCFFNLMASSRSLS
jgi:hypothetical protein